MEPTAVGFLASGSKGNIFLVRTPKGCWLIDVGLSCRETERRLRLKNVEPYEVKGIFVTHEHSDHIRGISVFSRKHKTPVWATEGTIHALQGRGVTVHRWETLRRGDGLDLDDFRLTPFGTSHDAVDPVGYHIALENIRLGLATDLGVATPEVEEALLGCEMLFLESNHDVGTLQANPRYPWPLKKRILSDSGHLSNPQSNELMLRLAGSTLKRVVLAHLSEENNLPEIALQSARGALADNGLERIKIGVAQQHKVGPLYVLPVNGEAE